MGHRVVDEIGRANVKSDRGDFRIGDTVDVHVRIVEGEKERIQVFRGIVIGRKGAGSNESFTVRRLVAGEGVERVFPLCSPMIDKIAVRKHGKIRRAKLYYLRDRTGKATKVAERRVIGEAVADDIVADLAATELHPAPQQGGAKEPAAQQDQKAEKGGQADKTEKPGGQEKKG